MNRRLALLEVLDRDGRAARTVDVQQWPLTLGRALDNDVVIDDAFVAAHHATLAPDADGRLALTVASTDNGARIDNRQRVQAGQTLPLPAAGALLQLGATRLRLRLPGEVLAPEKPMPGLQRGHWTRPLLAGAALAVLQIASHWINLDPGADYSAWLPLLIGVPLALVAWCGIWALLSKLFQHRFDFAGHLRIVLPWLLAIGLAESLLPQAAAALGLPSLWYLAPPLQALLAALMVRAHLSQVLPLHPRAVAATVAAVAVAGSAISLALTHRSSDSFSNAPYMSTLPPPALRLAGGVPAQVLVQEMAPLAQKLAKRVKKSKEDDGDEDGAEGESE